MSKFDVAAIVAFYNEGNSTKQTADKFELQLHEVRTILNVGGVKMRRGRKSDGERAKLVRRLYKLMEEYGVDEVKEAMAELTYEEEVKMDIAA